MTSLVVLVTIDVHADDVAAKRRAASARSSRRPR
jgi:hypothetical protein